MHQKLSKGLQSDKEREGKKLAKIKVREKEKWKNDLKMKESKKRA